MDKISKYIIPFKSKPIKIGQGFNQGTHKDWPEYKEDFTYSVDFIIPENTEIIASREGIVTNVKESGKENYSGKNLEKGEIAYQRHMNYLEIKHSDGTFAQYSHLAYMSSFVKKGEKVKQGQKIALSGNTGWSSKPHLDFSVVKKNMGKYKIKSIPFKFKDYKKSLYSKNG